VGRLFHVGQRNRGLAPEIGGHAIGRHNDLVIAQGWLIKELDGSMQLTTTILGFMAGTLTTISFVPQLHKVWRSKRCHDLSWGMLITFSLGVALWLAYGLFLRAAPIIVTNAVTLALLITISVLKVRYRHAEG